MTPADLQLFFEQNWPIAAAVVFSGIMVAYGFSATIKGYKTVAAEQAVRLVNDGATVIDVRPADDFAKGHINGAESAGLETLKQRFDRMDKERIYLLYCQSGNRSSVACAAMRKAGFTRIFNLQMGINGWRSASLPLAREKAAGKRLPRKARAK